MNSEQVSRELLKVKVAIANLFNKIGDDIYDIEYKKKADDLQRQDEFTKILDKLYDCNSVLSYLAKPVIYTGQLKKNSNGRYEANGRELTCGQGIEVLIYDEYQENDRWVITRVEHDSQDYYIVGYEKVPLQGLTIRIRRS